MTTKVHIVNFGPDALDVYTVNPVNGSYDLKNTPPTVYAQQSVDLYVHATQAIRISEKGK